jgi:ribonucleoside-diphosphate reductase alpha chain
MSLTALKNSERNPFRTSFAENIFRTKYAQGPNDSWPALCRRLVEDVCGKGVATKWHFDKMSKDEKDQLVEYMIQMKCIPGGRYLYYAGRSAHFWNNCFTLRAEEDTREEWGLLDHKVSDCLMSGGGIGVDYSRIRPYGRILSRTGGISSGPLPLMKTANEIGRYVMQGGSRRSALYASLNWRHDDILDFIYAKNWPQEIVDLKAKDFNFPAPLDMTNISVNWDTEFIESVKEGDVDELWELSVRQTLMTGEPGHSFNFFKHENETLRNACAEITSEDDSDVCNLGAVNMSRIDNVDEFKDVTQLLAKFLVCGSVRGELPYQKVYEVRNRNRRIGVGLMGVHEWLLKRGYMYEVTDELKQWLTEWELASERGANEICDRFYLNRPIKYRAIAPTGTIGILASTTTGIEPLFATAYKRRYLVTGTQWKYEYVVDATAHKMIEEYALKPEEIETAYSLASTPEKRILFQKHVQRHVDHAISSTINLPAWGSEQNNEDTVKPFAEMLLSHCDGLRGITAYPNGSRGGQPLEEVSYDIALVNKGVVFDEYENKCAGEVCGV